MMCPFSCNHPSLCFVFMEDRPAPTAFNCAQIYQLYELFDCFLYLLDCLIFIVELYIVYEQPEHPKTLW